MGPPGDLSVPCQGPFQTARTPGSSGSRASHWCSFAIWQRAYVKAHDLKSTFDHFIDLDTGRLYLTGVDFPKMRGPHQACEEANDDHYDQHFKQRENRDSSGVSRVNLEYGAVFETWVL